MVHQCTHIEQNALEVASSEVGEGVAHPTRIAILRLLAECGEQCSCEIEPRFDVDPSGVSRHLSALRRAGLVVSRRDGVRVLHRLASPRVVELVALIDQIALEEGGLRRARWQMKRTQHRVEVKRRAPPQER